MTAEEYFEKGQEEYNKENYEEAILSYINVLKTYKNNIETYVNIGVSFLKLKKYEDSLFYLNKAVAINNKDIY